MQYDLVRITIVARDAPALPHGTLSIQIGKQHEQSQPLSRKPLRFSADVERRDGDYYGDAVHGKKGDRFLYLVWETNVAPGERQMHGRTKIRFNLLPADLADASRITVSVSLSADGETPRYAGLKPEHVSWTDA